MGLSSLILTTRLASQVTFSRLSPVSPSVVTVPGGCTNTIPGEPLRSATRNIVGCGGMAGGGKGSRLRQLGSPSSCSLPSLSGAPLPLTETKMLSSEVSGLK